MEIELKYKIPAEDIAEKIWINQLFFHMEEEGSREESCFDAKYFDTPDYDLKKNELAYRIRKEGERWVAALKWKGHSEGALHTREEINVPVEDDTPNPGVFAESEIGSKLLDVIGDKPLHSFLQTRFRRRRFRLDTGTGIFEISIDQGRICTDYGEEPISEVEIELFSGETEELVRLGGLLQEKYHLETEDTSKYARGIALIRENT